MTVHLGLANFFIPTRGTASLVIGISSDTMFMNTVRESMTVTPGNMVMNYLSSADLLAASQHSQHTLFSLMSKLLSSLDIITVRRRLWIKK